MEHLFTSYRLKHLVFKNRIVMPPLASFLLENNGRISDQTIEHYRRRAAGGPAMVIMEACSVSDDGVVSSHQARISHDSFLDGFSKIAQAIKSEGSIPAIQIHHGGRQIPPRVIKKKPLAPSPLPCPAIRAEVEPMTVGQIQDMVQNFVIAADRARKAGFELIEIHGAHGYLINQFLSRFSNIREDEYGGDIHGRARFAREVVEGVRGCLGEDFPLSFKISAQEFVPNGLTVEESVEILRIMIEAGIDAIQVSAGNDATPEWISQPMFMEKACLVDSAARIKQALGIPVMTVGRINSPFIADDIIAKGKADLVCIGRGLLADPDMPLKAQAGRFDEIRRCIACNTCMESIFKLGRIECLVNPTLGKEKEMAIVPAARPRRIMVVGGGPAGMNAAWVASKRGHQVDLFEARSELGGKLIPGSRPGYKNELKSLIRFQRNQINNNGVKCHLGREVTPAVVREYEPDVVIIATGAQPLIPDVEGIDQDIVVTFEEVLTTDQCPAQKTIVIGGGHTGCEIALHLAERGGRVTIVEMMPQIGKLLEAMTRKVMLAKLRENKVDLLPEHRLIRVSDDGVWVESTADGNERFLPAEKVVIAMGAQPNTRLYDQIKDAGLEIHQIGDCLEPRNAKAAIHEAARIGRLI